ncbi:hypothetical protein N7457_005716 [Penicillium paradoxum]|uniref:uncharacterized protein n=1 Tax=Penicillium paradoxum TaxID=176176 RepID=UPI0025485FF4|nr:uncharacterized protein N7457_005716 [Penicillium paradoxum]KAJ5780556.1 hypothetical protein N7457_005716 [Penicillium paradoxum]
MEGLQMNDTNSSGSNESYLPLEYFIGPTSFHADESEQSVDDSGASTPVHDSQSVEEDDQIRVIKPYAIEEPDDEPECIMPWPDVPCLPDPFERWQRDLVDYMNDLNYQPDGHNPNGIPAVRKRGQKRKPSLATGATQHLKQRHALAESHAQAREHCTKRQKFGKQMHEYSQGMDPFEGFREAKVNESSSSETQSVDLSGIDTVDNSPMVDEMDID